MKWYPYYPTVPPRPIGFSPMSPAPLLGLVPLEVSNSQYAGRTTCTRLRWRRRFLALCLFGIWMLLSLGRPLYVIFTGFPVQYALLGHIRPYVSLTEAEQIYSRTLADSNYARNWSYQYTQESHNTGSNIGLVDWTLDKFKEYGLHDTRVETYHVYLNKPVDHALRLVDDLGKTVYEASLQEDLIPEDPTTQEDLVPTYHGYSANGNVTAPYFYANYGRKQDYQLLVDRGYNITGKIAIVRYGAILRGLKIKFAEELGVVGVVIYSDPSEDGKHIPQNGFKQHPKGPSKQESSVERGSVMYLTEGSGDPTTPGYASKEGVERQDPLRLIPRIPSLPVSYRDILPILKKLNGIGPKGSSLGPDWTGKLQGYDYSLGLTKNEKFKSLHLNLYNEQDYDIFPVHNVLGSIPGLSDEVIVIGNHRDAWIRGGAGDPNSGSAVMLEIMRALQAANKHGYVPYRSILFASWDGEESGLLGLTEWGEDHAAWIQKNVAAYLNLDSAVIGTSLKLGLSPLLTDVLLEVAKNVSYPKGGSLFEHHKHGAFAGEVPFLGSGSDFSVFVDHLGIPALHAFFDNNPDNDPVYHYHSNYDSFYWMETFCDPGFVYHNTMAQYFGRVLLKMSGVSFSPLNPELYSRELGKYVQEAFEKVPAKWYHYEEPLISFDPSSIDLLYQVSKQLGLDSLLPKKKFSRNTAKNSDMTEDTNNFTDAVESTLGAVEFFQEQATKAVTERNKLQALLDENPSGFWSRIRLLMRLRIINTKFNYLERVFLHSEGLDGRSWFKHVIFASGRYTGYDGQAIPGFQEAIEDDDVASGLRWLNVLRKKIEAAGYMISM